MTTRVLRLHLKGEYFDAIRAGTKPFEYRLAEKWEPRLQGHTFDEIHLFRGYPKRGDESRTLRRQWRGYTRETRQHPHFGPDPVQVLAIDVRTPLAEKVPNSVTDLSPKTA